VPGAKQGAAAWAWAWAWLGVARTPFAAMASCIMHHIACVRMCASCGAPAYSTCWARRQRQALIGASRALPLPRPSIQQYNRREIYTGYHARVPFAVTKAAAGRAQKAARAESREQEGNINASRHPRPPLTPTSRERRRLKVG
jgi:hypothetical protein